MSQTKKFLLSALVLAVLFVASFGPISWIFSYKELDKPWDMTTKIRGFYNEPRDSFP
ncbi:MAG: hypothetical protein QM813_24380 [Verrucomicrobiota bacterium]